ncbi:outer dynein arm-docking complex subunit 4 isoform X2 [Neoarius graeffei]|uniref:outer dynein arm-docking complex subunit 4 isoform X2 n=1 Tax=Neoarius graeffei TaxID=443677 RepID=UPI00298BE745|nr:outer dynein arm-docking complex subunit 4 isoform X2 [Neoarius graeffei]
MLDNEGEESLKSTFSTFMAEGDQLFHKGQYSKAIERYSTGLYQKAEALYGMGDFEFALVFYHRGHKLRPELQEFRLGIQKAEEAITNSVGSPSSVKLENKRDLSSFHKVDEHKKAQPKNFIHPLKRDRSPYRQKTLRSERTAKQLLGELYTDKQYLEKLLKDEDLIKGKTRSGEKLQDVIMDCISYLDTRTKFWQQQKPIYAHERDRKAREQQRSRARNRPPSDPTFYVLKNLEDMDAELAAGNTESSLKKAQEVLKKVQGWSEKVLPNKTEVMGNLYSFIGNALMDLGNMGKALENHFKDLELAQQSKLMDSKSRALDNIGRVYARIGKFHQAVKVWEEKIPLVQDELEKAWLFHEIGHCYLEMRSHTKARDYGIQSLSAANNIRDEKWQLNANVLVAQAELKLGNYESSVLYFETALDQARALQDDDASAAIQKALQETRQQMPQ